MYDVPLAMIMSARANARELHSARPHAPVRPDAAPPARRQPTRRARTALAGFLHRAASAIEPAECTLAR
ncbi:hypothetical protein [Plantactinospora sp. KBS50]|uniref:hypothetical protein n=1 Tax=Plantactinospora sp. KBS50 TaxID=2024580 RepID=UPI000BAAF2FE|nr:hypothetical protein [Plantactinospora sp. KBS50]ASW54471.1 hypothetical protein CIK06_10155 [Plantactinospora sp. KBS50]